MNYKRVYCKFFQYYMGDDEWIPSEISGETSVDIHHIFSKQMGGKKIFIHNGKEYDIDCIDNLIAVTRDEHLAAHDETDENHKTKDELWDIHQIKMADYLRVSKSKTH